MRIQLERIKTNAGKRWASSRTERLVRIISTGYFWKRNRRGYTGERDQAGVYTFADALNASAHCGPEKHVIYEFLPHGEGAPTQEPSGPARLLLRSAI